MSRLRKWTTAGPIAGIFAIAALLPFERIGSFSVAGVSVRASQVVLLAVLLALARLMIHGRVRIDWQRPEMAWLAVFFGVCAVSLLNAGNFRRSLLVLAFVIFTAALTVAMPALIDRPEQLQRIRKIILISAAIVGLFGLWQFVADMAGAPAILTGLRPQYTKAILGFTRIQSTALEPLYFADYLLLPISFAAAMLLSGADKKTSPRLYALLALLFLDLLLTASRGGYAGFAASMLVIAWMYRHRLPALKRAAAVAGLGILALALGFILLGSYAVTTPGSLADTFITHVSTVTDGAAYVERLGTFSAALQAFTLHPLLGVGIGGYGPFAATYANVQPDAGWAIVNNETLELLAEVGVLGFAAFAVFLYFVFKSGLRPVSPELEPIRVAAVAALAGMLVQYQTFSTLYIMHIWFTIGLILAVTSLRSRSI